MNLIIDSSSIDISPRATVMMLLRKHLGENVELDHRQSGAPFIRGVENLSVSISHSHRYAAVAIGRQVTVGIDIEETCRYRQLERVRSKFLSACEQNFADVDLLEAWTIKEAVYKAALTPGLALSEIILPRDGGTVASARGVRYSITLSRCEDYAMAVAVGM